MRQTLNSHKWDEKAFLLNKIYNYKNEEEVGWDKLSDPVFSEQLPSQEEVDAAVQDLEKVLEELS